MPPPDVRAAGAVVTRKGGDVLLVHRPRYDDWSFPKGKLDPDEHVTTAAVREVAEETGLDVRLGPALATQRYDTGRGRMKTVNYWVARVQGDDDVSGYLVNDEIDEVEWVPWAEAAERLTYEHDRETLEEARRLRRRTRALVVLRHGHARSRRSWKGDDRRRPLLLAGEAEAQRLVPVLAAFDATEVHSSSSVRCVQTVTPYVHTTGWPLHSYDELSEEGVLPPVVDELVEKMLAADSSAVLCTHRPVLPTVLASLGLADVKLEPAEMLVVHHRKGRVVAADRIGL
ncbi:NUDIX hydrolase [Nocardioides currus]|uniref:NUDIX hydrolase n=1 Tax=Nocardioides currus TaxID=2133958 RepID=A0A2R7YZX7_9ACTN|nr:NUDIX domain-containing protein [Nocardioides currus]PUA81459.1 NUDIX hydrolase [Nocardioides currus]